MTHITIGDRKVGDEYPCYIIAEIGVNHNGDLATAKQLVDAAIWAGVDAVKFQKRHLAHVYQQAILDRPSNGEQGLQYLIPLLKEFELSDEEFFDLVRYCRHKGVAFLCTPWDNWSVDFLEMLGFPAYKVGSPDMTNLLLIDYILTKHKPLLLSTGMSTEDEIRCTLAFVKERAPECALFHCTSTYPAAPDEVNLRFMQTLREWSGWPVGYSGHEPGIAISLAAVAQGASMLERHLTLDRTMRGPDHSASLEPKEFADLVLSVREVEEALGVAHRWITRGELLNRRVLGKSLVAKQDITAGTVIERSMVTSKSPGLGLSPQVIDRLVGRISNRSMCRDELFVESDLGEVVYPRQTGKIDVGTPWGVIARFTDLGPLLNRFQPEGLSLVEFHVSDRDLDDGIEAFHAADYPFDLVVHAPEYYYDSLIDLCSQDDKQYGQSIRRIQQSIDLARQMARYFRPSDRRGPKVIVHVGGMSPSAGAYDVDAASDRLLSALHQLDKGEVDLLLENLPPYPWYFGGRWFGHILLDVNSTRRICAESGLGLCFDTSHAGLECIRNGTPISEYATLVSPYIRHLHISDAAGNSGEGLQIGEGQINFVEIMPLLLKTQAGLVPEIWMGHHQVGQGFRRALERLTELVWAGRVLGRPVEKGVRPELSQLAVPSYATVFTALQIIDANKMGIGFVVDNHKVVLGVVTDGDIRHGLASGRALSSPISEIMTRAFVFAREGTPRSEIQTKLPGRTRVMPILDSENCLVGVASDDFSE